MIDLRLGDCLDVLPTLEAGSVDAVVTDPPYNVGLNYASTNDRRADYALWCKAWGNELWRVAQTVSFTPGTPNVHLWLDMRDPDVWLCNWRPNGAGYSKAGFCHWEPMLVWGPIQGKRRTDVIRAPIIHDEDAEPHPCPKPIAWAVQAIELLAPKGGTVLDPFMGSGTTGVACVQTGRSFIGIELDAGYFEIARQRIEAAQREMVQLAL